MKRYRYTVTVIINGRRWSVEQAAEIYELWGMGMIRGEE
jgi:hypothetical protein